MKGRIRWLWAPGLLVAIGCTTAKQAAAPAGTEAPERAVQRLPIDPRVTYGRLENGIEYIVRENQKPEKRAELRLALEVGSVLEDDDQQGLAHFVEHMAFNGTRRFPKQALVDFMEKIGMGFGPHLNAHTSYDETVYKLRVPTDSAHLVERAFDILEDWATGITFEGEEIDKERGVVVEEWRSGRGAEARVRDRQWPLLFKNSRYADRLPIGKKAVLDTFGHETVRRFYRDWYRPELMHIVAVGDFDADWIEDLIRKRFSRIPPSGSDARKRFYASVPGHNETLFAIATDPEMPTTSVVVVYKQPVREQGTVEAYRDRLKVRLYSRMLNERLNELTKRPNPPFLGAGTGQGLWVRTKEIYFLGAGVKEDGLIPGLEALIREASRVQRHGFTATELEREKVNTLRGFERAFEERDKQRSGGLAGEYVRHFMDNESIPGIEIEFELAKTLLPGIQLGEVNRLATEWITDRDRVVLVTAPEKAGVEIPTEQQLLAAVERVRGEEIVPYVDAVADISLLSNVPAPGTIVAEKQIPETGLTEWTLSNGVRVGLKPTDFKNDQILFASYSAGGHSLVEDPDYIPASTAVAVLGEGGLGAFDQIELRKKLAGKAVSISPWIGELQEGMSGSASPKDLETMFQLVYLAFTAPRTDSSAFMGLQGANARVAAEPGQGPGVGLRRHDRRDHGAVPLSRTTLDDATPGGIGPAALLRNLPRSIRRRERFHVRVCRESGPRPDETPDRDLSGRAAVSQSRGDVARHRSAAPGREGEENSEARAGAEKSGPPLLDRSGGVEPSERARAWFDAGGPENQAPRGDAGRDGRHLWRGGRRVDFEMALGALQCFHQLCVRAGPRRTVGFRPC